MGKCGKPAYRAITWSPYGNPVPACRDCYDLARGVIRKNKLPLREAMCVPRKSCEYDSDAADIMRQMIREAKK